MSTWRARLGVIAIFVVGFLGGGVTVQLVNARAISHALSHPKEWPERVANHLTRRLDLTREQQREVRAILGDARRESASTLRRVQPGMLASFDRTQSRIRAVLNPEQQKKFERISARRRAHFLERFGPPGGAPDVPPASAPSSQPL
jgi:Spy/CpxP family protein refolding chaperone